MKKIILLLAMLVVLAACSNEAKTDSASETTNSAPTFALKDTTGKTYNLDYYKGKKVYLKFWASWCPICLSGLEEVDTLATEEEDFVVLSVVAPGFNNEKKTDAFIKWISGVEEVKNLPVLLDEDGVIAKQYGILGYPTSVFISSDGALIKTSPGHLSNDQIKEQFDSID